MNAEKTAGAAGATGILGVIGLSVSGLSASEMTALLAAIGKVVGGGMAAGIAVVAAAPLAVGASAFWATKGIKSLIDN